MEISTASAANDFCKNHRPVIRPLLRLRSDVGRPTNFRQFILKHQRAIPLPPPSDRPILHLATIIRILRDWGRGEGGGRGEWYASAN